MKSLLLIFLIYMLTGCADPLSDDKNEYVGLWKNNQTSLLITKAGRIEYESNKGSVKTSVSMPIKSITSSELVAGFLFINSNFLLSGPPTIEDGRTVLTVDGEDLYKFGNDGKAVLSLEIPSFEQIRTLVTNDLNLLSDSIATQDFSNYLSLASMQYQSQYTNEKLIELYQPFVEQKIELKKWMAGDFVLSDEPVIKENGVLLISGKYPTSPNSLKFSLNFVFSGGAWKSLGPDVSINDQ